MKKLLIALTVAVAAGMIPAATVNWNSGSLRSAASATGGWYTGTGSAIKNHMADGTKLAASVFLVSADDYTAAQALTQEGLYAQYSKATATASNEVADQNNVIVATTATKGTDYYAVVLFTYTDTDYGEMYMATTATIAGTMIDNADNTYNVANIGSTIGTATTDGGWQAVPEPTSGMLLLVGCALMALKRKRA